MTIDEFASTTGPEMVAEFVAVVKSFQETHPKAAAELNGMNWSPEKWRAEFTEFLSVRAMTREIGKLLKLFQQGRQPEVPVSAAVMCPDSGKVH